MEERLFNSLKTTCTQKSGGIPTAIEWFQGYIAGSYGNEEKTGTEELLTSPFLSY